MNFDIPTTPSGNELESKYNIDFTQSDEIMFKDNSLDRDPNLDQHLEELISGDATDNPIKGILLVRTANQVMDDAKNQPIPQKLFGSLWFEGELCIFYGDTNTGKSILAVLIAHAISTGQEVLTMENHSEKQIVAYFDFELTDKQFEKRYSNEYEDHFQFDNNLIRVAIDPNGQFDENRTFEDQIVYAIEQYVINNNVKILIVDNLTYLRGETEKAKDALPLMKKLKALKEKYGLSILVLSHTPKRDRSKPITKAHLSGSSMLMNFCDASFAIGESSIDPDLRYLKQVKVRSSEMEYGAENIVICRIEKEYNFLGFTFERIDAEYRHLYEKTPTEQDDLVQQVRELHEQGLSLREIADKVGKSHTQVGRYLKRDKGTE